MGIHHMDLHIFDAETMEEYEIEDPVSYVNKIAFFEENEDGIHLKVGGRDYYASQQGIEEIYSGGGINSMGKLAFYKDINFKDYSVHATVLWNYGVFTLYYTYERGAFKIYNYEISF